MGTLSAQETHRYHYYTLPCWLAGKRFREGLSLTTVLGPDLKRRSQSRSCRRTPRWQHASASATLAAHMTVAGLAECTSCSTQDLSCSLAGRCVAALCNSFDLEIMPGTLFFVCFLYKSPSIVLITPHKCSNHSRPAIPMLRFQLAQSFAEEREKPKRILNLWPWTDDPTKSLGRVSDMQERHPETETLWEVSNFTRWCTCSIAEHRALASYAVGAQDLSSSRFHSSKRERGRN